jgi:hypothetical protein
MKRENLLTQTTKKKIKKSENTKLKTKIIIADRLNIIVSEKFSNVLISIKQVAANITGILRRFE